MCNQEFHSLFRVRLVERQRNASHSKQPFISTMCSPCIQSMTKFRKRGSMKNKPVFNCTPNSLLEFFFASFYIRADGNPHAAKQTNQDASKLLSRISRSEKQQAKR